MAGGHRHFAPERVVTWLAMAGFMGTGKSRIGWELSRRLQLTFIDTDRVIERVSCMRIPDLFELYGEGVFRDYETEVVRRSVRLDEVVISTGGGTVVRPENRAILRARGPVVVLTASPETIFRRTRRNKRPLLEHADPLKRIGELMAARGEAYDDVASFKVSTDGRPSAEVVEEIVERLQDWKREQDARLAGDESRVQGLAVPGGEVDGLAEPEGDAPDAPSKPREDGDA